MKQKLKIVLVDWNLVLSLRPPSNGNGAAGISSYGDVVEVERKKENEKVSEKKFGGLKNMSTFATPTEKRRTGKRKTAAVVAV